MKINSKLSIYSKDKLLACTMALFAIVFSSCNKQSGYSLAPTAVNSVIQINVNSTNYSLAQAPDVISFTTLPVVAATPLLGQYVIKGTSSNGTVAFTLNFHINTIGSGYYVMDSSQLFVNSKTYISVAKESTDKIVVTALDSNVKTYSGTFSFYSFNKALATDSVLVTGIYTIQ